MKYDYTAIVNVKDEKIVKCSTSIWNYFLFAKTLCAKRFLEATGFQLLELQSKNAIQVFDAGNLAISKKCFK